MTAKEPTWSELVKLEPRLGELLARAKAIVDDGGESFCANHRWVGCGNGPACEKCRGGLKDELVMLVGWEASNPELESSEAYDVAYDKVYKALPDCRNCGCA
jgi:hypothetical protein